MTAYSVTPVGAAGLEEERAGVVHGPKLRDALSGVEKARRYAELLVELDRAYADLDRAQRLIHAMDGRLGDVRADRDRSMEQRWEAEVGLRVTYQSRLSRAARALHAIGQAHPEVRPMIDQARKDIWP